MSATAGATNLARAVLRSAKNTIRVCCSAIKPHWTVTKVLIQPEPDLTRATRRLALLQETPVRVIRTGPRIISEIPRINYDPMPDLSIGLLSRLCDLAELTFNE